MHKAVIVAVVVLVCLPALLSAKGASRRQKARQGGRSEDAAQPRDCGQWTDGQCVVKNNATCGRGTMMKTRTGDNCPVKEKSTNCEVPCPAGGSAKASGGRNGKSRKAVCKYEKSEWSRCDPATNTKSRTETLKTTNRRNSAPSTECEPTRVQTKKCRTSRKNRRGPSPGGQ